MSRAAGGTYTLPAGNPVITGTVISSTWANTTLTDIATALTDSLSRTGLGSMTASLFLPDGTAALPSLAFTNSTTTGLYRGGADILGFSTAGVSRGTISAAGNWAIAAPSSGTALAVTGLGNAVPQISSVGSNGVPVQIMDVAAVPSAALTIVIGSATAAYPGGSGISGDLVLSPRTSAACGISLATNGSNRLFVGGAGNVTIAAPSSGNTLTLFPAVGAGASIINAAGDIGAGYFLTGRNTSTTDGRSCISFIADRTSTKQFDVGIDPDGSNSKNFSFRDVTGGRIPLIIGTNGNVTINAPSSGGALAVAGLTGTNTVNLTSTGAAGALSLGWSVGFGSFWNIYTNSTDGLFVGTSGAASLQLVSNATARAVINSSGTMTINAPAAASPGLIVTGSASTPVNAIGNSSTAFTIDFSRSNVHTVTMTGNVPGGSLTLSNAQDGQTINVFLTQDGTGTRTLGYPASVKWPGGVAGILSTPINTVDLLTLTFRSSTGFYYASLVKAFA